MLKKLSKYDLRSVRKLWIIFALISVCASVIGSFTLKVILYDEFNHPLISILGLLGTYAAFMAILIFPIVMFILVFLRFYKNFYTDEGYLTFTLPVKRGTLLMSKTLNAMIWTVLSSLVMFFCFFII